MTRTPIAVAQVVAGSSLPLRARVSNPETGTYLVPGEVAGVELIVKSEGGSSLPQAVSGAVEASLQPWSIDDEGYNLEVLVPANLIPSPGTKYVAVVEVGLDPSNTIIRHLWRIETEREPS